MFSGELDMAFRTLNEHRLTHSTAQHLLHTEAVHLGLADVIFTKSRSLMSYVVPVMNSTSGSMSRFPRGRSPTYTSNAEGVSRNMARLDKRW